MAQQLLAGDPTIREADPVLTFDAQTLYFTRPDHPRNQGTLNEADVWIRRRTANGKWSRALNPGSPVNSFGDDRLLGASVDGKRLAVVRNGTVPYLDLLEQVGRSWRVIESWHLPDDFRENTEFAFNVNSQEMVYTCREVGGTSSDLCARRARPRGEWSPARHLNELNSMAHEGRPTFAADGRTLYFRRGPDQWYRQLDRGEPVTSVEMPENLERLAVAAETAVVTTDKENDSERLLSLALLEGCGIPAGRLTYATLGTPPLPGESLVEVPLNSGVGLTVRPDVLQRYAIVLREGEIDFPESVIPSLGNTRAPGSLASNRSDLPSDIDKRQEYLRQSIAEGQRNLKRLDALRRKSYTGIVSQDDPERAALRNRLRRVNEANGDTLPPSTGGDTRSRYAQDLSELERMKAKFRRQQEERLRQRDRSGRSEMGWSDLPIATDTLEGADENDTTALKARLRTVLAPDQRPTPYARREWENRITDDLPSRSVLSAEEAARLDEEFAAQQRKIDALRARLREVERGTENPTASDALVSRTPAASLTIAKSPVATTGITFIDNTAYPNSGGYIALDELTVLVQRASSVVEIRVHVDASLDSRAAQRLSEERAVTIREHLTKAGIARDNYRVIGYGNHEPEGGERVVIIQ